MYQRGDRVHTKRAIGGRWVLGRYTRQIINLAAEGENARVGYGVQVEKPARYGDPKFRPCFTDDIGTELAYELAPREIIRDLGEIVPCLGAKCLICKAMGWSDERTSAVDQRRAARGRG